MKKTEIEPCFGYSIRRANRVISQIYNEHFASIGLRGTQFTMLRALHYMGTTTAAQLREALVLEQTTVSRALQPLIRDGYIVASEGETKREKNLSLTREGETLYQQALVPWQAAQQQVKKVLSTTQQENLLRLNKKIVGMKS